MVAGVERFPFRYSRLSRWLLTPFLMGPNHARVELHPDRLEVRMGLAFRAAVARSAITGASVAPPAAAVGVHGWRGRWRVTSSRVPTAQLTIEPPSRGRFNGIPLRLRELRVAVEEPERLVAALTRR